ncbi:MAG: ribose 5-phosphate isomerase B [Candidatus Omnitrophica bacterium]|nr:ribose 5-phosphate isomerase B [Candidatus Omnitrophota bacterium]
MKQAIIIASDHAGFRRKEQIKAYLLKKGFSVTDVGTHSEDSCDYPDFVFPLAQAIAQKKFARGIVICKSGIGSAIAANKIPGVRAALCYNATAARLSREHNDSNVLVLGSAFVNEKAAQGIIRMWLSSEFQGGRHIRRLRKIKKIEHSIMIGR